MRHSFVHSFCRLAAGSSINWNTAVEQEQDELDVRLVAFALLLMYKRAYGRVYCMLPTVRFGLLTRGSTSHTIFCYLARRMYNFLIDDTLK